MKAPRLFTLVLVAMATLSPLAAASAEPADDAGAGWISGVRFALPAGSPIRGSPVVSGGLVFFGSTDGRLHAADARSGKIHWRLATGGAVDSTPAIDSGYVYFTSRDGFLYAVAAANGRLAWKQALGKDLRPHNYWDYFLSSPTIDAGSVIVGSGDGSVRSFDARTGRLRWRFDAGARIRSTPAVAEGHVVVGTMDGHVIALHERDGSLAWRFATAGASRTFEEVANDATSVFTTPAISGGRVFVGARDGNLYALDLRGGELLWRTTHDGSSWILSTVADATRLYVGSGSAQIVQAADPATGAEIWHTPIRAAAFSRIRVRGDTLLFTDFAGNVEAMDRQTGRPLWRFPMGARSLSTPTLDHGIVYCGSDSGILFALDVAPRQASSVSEPRRIVYAAGGQGPEAFAWFLNGVDAAIAAQLASRGYERMDTAHLVEFIRGYGAGSPRAVVVMADNRIAPELVAEVDGRPLIRRFLDAGGKVALLGPNPLSYVTDPASGALTGLDHGVPLKVFGVAYEPQHDVGGYYASIPTPQGQRMGLRDAFVGFPALAPDRDTTAIAIDEFGKASAWLRGYGGAPGMGLLQLPLPRSDVQDLSQAQAVIEFGVTW
jgi:outer membrane protein assembly factor BamB